MPADQYEAYLERIVSLADKAFEVLKITEVSVDHRIELAHEMSILMKDTKRVKHEIAKLIYEHQWRCVLYFQLHNKWKALVEGINRLLYSSSIKEEDLVMEIYIKDEKMDTSPQNIEYLTGVVSRLKQIRSELRVADELRLFPDE